MCVNCMATRHGTIHAHGSWVCIMFFMNIVNLPPMVDKQNGLRDDISFSIHQTQVGDFLN